MGFYSHTPETEDFEDALSKAHERVILMHSMKAFGRSTVNSVNIHEQVTMLTDVLLAYQNAWFDYDGPCPDDEQLWIYNRMAEDAIATTYYGMRKA